MNSSFDHFSHYNHVGQWGSGGAWGSMEHTGDGTSSHKYRALVDFSNAHPVSVAPAPALSVRTAAPPKQGSGQAFSVLGRRVSSRGDDLARRLAPGVYLTLPAAPQTGLGGQ